MKKISLLLALACMMCGLQALADTYTITTADEWNALVTNDDGYAGDVINITADLTFSTSITALGSSTAFAGEINGNGHTITEGYYPLGQANYGALVITADTTAYIHDLTMAASDQYLLMGKYEGVVVGTLYGTIENVTVTATENVTAQYCGGVVGSVYGTVKNCTYSGTFTGGTTYQGGIAGYVYSGGTVTGCSFNGTFTSSYSYAGGIAGYVANGGTVSDCTFDGTLTHSSTSATTYTAGIAGYVVNGGTVTNCGVGENGSVSGSCSVGGVIGYVTGANASVTGCYNKGTVTGSGTYTGGIVGRAYTSANIVECYNAGTVTSSGTYAGGIVGYAYTNANIQECYNAGTVTSSGAYAGGMVGYAAARHTITDCWNEGTVSTTASAGYAAGILAYMANYSNSSSNLYSVTLTRCYNKGTVSSDGYAAGIFGLAKANTTSSTAGSSFGLVNMTGCYNTADITSSGRANGLASTYTPGGTYTDCYNTGDISGESTYTSGLFGYYSGNQLSSITIYTTFSGCYNTGAVTSSTSMMAGVLGYLYKYATLDGCYSTGDVTGLTYVGGIVGITGDAGTSTISSCYNAGTVTLTSTSTTASTVTAGGIIGYTPAATEISGCFNVGDIVDTGLGGASYIGGVTGLGSKPVITNCYNMGDVSGAYAGGIAGYRNSSSTGTISYVYNAGTVSGTTSGGTITGGTTTTGISSAYYLSTTATGGSYDDVATALTYSELATLSLGDSWTAGDNYTYPRITAIADNDYAKAYAAAVIPDVESDTYDAMTGAFYLGAPDGVTWAADNSVISYDGQMGYFNASYSGGTITMAATSGDVTVTAALVYGVTTGIDDTLSDSDLAAAEIVSETLYNTSGQIVTAPADGQKAIYIVRRVYSDGSVTTAKEVR